MGCPEPRERRPHGAASAVGGRAARALQIAAPTHLVDVNGLAMDKIEALPEGGLRIGALVRNTDLAARGVTGLRVSCQRK